MEQPSSKSYALRPPSRRVLLARLLSRECRLPCRSDLLLDIPPGVCDEDLPIQGSLAELPSSLRQSALRPNGANSWYLVAAKPGPKAATVTRSRTSVFPALMWWSSRRDGK
eukprot:TRINITY_DN36867_c0_g1_i1.p3 TRINITY_DN36867_c0_g1~~TRINITY_DN36867_c0_g1_i1.p3  ORF type:complete len:111 (+),score=10.19 TRINITY_DN36867_c0_g1_i1:320-652(+)